MLKATTTNDFKLSKHTSFAFLRFTINFPINSLFTYIIIFLSRFSVRCVVTYHKFLLNMDIHFFQCMYVLASGSPLLLFSRFPFAACCWYCCCFAVAAHFMFTSERTLTFCSVPLFLCLSVLLFRSHSFVGKWFRCCCHSAVSVFGICNLM